MLEMFYSTGMRLSELAGLNDGDVDLGPSSELRGQRKKERIVSVGSRANTALRVYLQRRDSMAGPAISARRVRSS